MAANDERQKTDQDSEAIQPTQPAKDVEVNIQSQAPLDVSRSESGSRATFLIGREFRTPKSWPWLNVFFGAFGLAGGGVLLLLALFAMSWGPVVVSAFFFFAALWCYLLRPAYRVFFDERAIQTYRPRQTLDYQEIMEVYAPWRTSNEGENFDIYLLHAYGYLLLPKTLQTQSESIYQFLQEQELAIRENPPVPVQMQTYLNRRMEAYGRAQIHVYRSHLRLKMPYHSRWLEYVTGSMIFSGFFGICLIAAYFDKQLDKEPVAMGGVILFSLSLVLGCFGYLIATFSRWVGEVRLWLERETVLIVSPGGLAVMYGNNSLFLSWDELRHANVMLDVQDSPSRVGITVWKGGLRIRVRDNLHWPLRHAVARIRSFLSASLQ